MQLIELLERLNSNYGRGKIISVEMVDDSNGIVTRKPFQCTPEKRKFRIVNGTLFFLRHQAKIK